MIIFILDRRNSFSKQLVMAEAAEESGNTLEAVAPPSKNALKRQLKRQRWEDSKADRRAYKKAKIKEKKEIMKQSGQRLPKKGRLVVEGQENSGIKVVIDCSFDDLMIDKVFPYAGLVELTLGNLQYELTTDSMSCR